jgi:hypothetical protein
MPFGKHRSARMINPVISALVLVLMLFGRAAHAQDQDITSKLQGFDAYMEQTLKDRFDTPDDEQYGIFSINFRTNPAGDIA